MSELKPIHIFRSGRHTAMNGASLDFSAADLAATARAYDPAAHEAPLVTGHPRHDAPAYGWVKSLAAAGENLAATPSQVEPAFAELVAAGRYKKISASFYTPESPANPKPGVYYLRHVGFLGAQPPAVKGLKQAEFAEDAEGTVTIDFAEGAADEALWAQFKRWLSGHLSAANTAPNSETLEHAEEVTTVTNDEIEAQKAKLKQQAQEMAAKEAAFAERETKIAAHEAKARRREIAEFVEAQIAAGKVLPRDQAGLIEFMAGLDAAAVLEFGEDQNTIKKPAAEWLRAFIEHLPKTIDYGEQAKADAETGRPVDFERPPEYSVDAERLALHRKALAYAETHDTDYVTAVNAVAH